MKKIIIFLSLIFIIMAYCTVYASEVNVQINGEIINFSDTNAQIINDRTMVPFRKIFNELGVLDDQIEWDSSTSSIIAKKDNIEIRLQIGNNIAEKTVYGKSTTITLDSAPVIRNDRTLVPLRFIAESLGKTVGWDAINRTAIIIDYDYFLNAIKSKSNTLYNFLNTQSANTSVIITRKYIDGDNNNNNNTATITANIEEHKNVSTINQIVTIDFSGNNELMQDIASEGWSNIKYENNYYDDYFTTKALTDGLKKVYGQEQLKFYYTGLKCEGKQTDTISDLFKNMSSINEKGLNIETFKSRKDEFSNFLKLFKQNSNGSYTTGNISSDSINLYYYDFTKLDNMLLDTPLNRVFSFLNSQIFNFDVTLEELCYDYTTMNMTINVNNSDLTIDFILLNKYNEKIEYIININKK